MCTPDVSRNRKVPVEPCTSARQYFNLAILRSFRRGLFESTDRSTAFLSSDLPWSSAQRLEVYDGKEKGCSNHPLVIVCFLALRTSPSSGPQRSALLVCALSVGQKRMSPCRYTYRNTVLPGDACAPRPFSGRARTSDRLSPRAAISERERACAASKGHDATYDFCHQHRFGL